MATGPSFVEYTASASQDEFGPVTFSGGAALRSAHVKAYVDGALVTAVVSGTLATPTVTLDTPCSGGEIVRIQRETPRTASTRVVDFENGSTLTATDLDESYLSALYATQEAVANIGASGASLPLDPGTGHYNANNLRVEDLAAPSASTDAATKGYVDTAAPTFTSGSTSSASTLTLNTALTAKNRSIQITNGTNTALTLTIASGTYRLCILGITSAGAVDGTVGTANFGKIVTSANTGMVITPPSGGYIQGYIERVA